MKASISFEDVGDGISIKVDFPQDIKFESMEDVPDSLRMAVLWCEHIVQHYLGEDSKAAVETHLVH